MPVSKEETESDMAIHIDIAEPKYRDAAAQILQRHENFQPEANITSAVRDFLILTGLAKREEIVEENPPSDTSRRAVDLTALDTFIEFKRRIGTVAGGEPDPENVQQLDDYLAQSASQGRVRMGILTDGRRWLLRWPGAGEVRLTRPYIFTLDDADSWFPLYEWLRDTALAALEDVSPDREGIAEHFGPGSPSYQRDIAALNTLYQEGAGLETIRVKRRLWYDLLRTALGEIAYTTEGMGEEAQARMAAVGVGDEKMDDLFVRHTYLGTVIGMVVQASFGIDIRSLAETDPSDLLQGRELYRATGLQGVLESDFFAWPIEVGGNPLLKTLARRVARFNWAQAPPDTAANLYETVIPPEERRQLGEYYTPVWLARAMVRSRNRYGIWAGGRYATQQDVAGLFFTRSVDLYLKDQGVIGFVLPHSALRAGQYSKWRGGRWRAGRSGLSVQVDFTFKPAWDLEQLEPNNFFPIPASVVFARKCPLDAPGRPLGDSVEQWRGKAGANDVRRESAAVNDIGTYGDSPYGGLSRNGATIFPRVLFFVNETENVAIVRAAPTVTVNPRRGSQDKAPWKDLDLTAITGQTVEDRHLFDVHLGETVAPYVTLEPLKALLPLKRGDFAIPTDDDGPGGVRLGGLERRMRERWQTVSTFWEDNKAPVNRLSLLGQLDYLHKLSSQLEWQKNSDDRQVRVVYSKSGQPTAAILHDNMALVENVLFWVPCRNTEEAYYLLAIINSDALREAVTPLMTKGLFGARDLHKRLWKLPIPKFDREEGLHTTIAGAGAMAAAGAAAKLEGLRGDKVTITIARRELRTWLRASPEGRAVETAVGRLLKGE